MITKMKGELEIDHNRGVIYFHLTDQQEVLRRMVATPLRLCNLPKPIPLIERRSLDLTHMVGCDWPGEYTYNKESVR